MAKQQERQQQKRRRRPARMSKQARRGQLLACAMRVVKSEGTAALTLARLAEAAGVTKPIAYGHFGTREGLLVALYEDYDERQAAAMREAVRARARTPRDVAEILAAAYVDCVIDAGEAGEEVVDALSAYDRAREIRDGQRATYVRVFRDAFAPFAGTPPPSELVYSAVLGAVEAVAQDAAAGRATRGQAVAALTGLIVAMVKRPGGRPPE